MKRAAFLAVLLNFTIIFAVRAQIFSVSEIDASNFPRVKANFTALNAKDSPYDNLTPSDFEVFELNENVSETVKIDCYEREVEPPASVALVLDISQSMNIPENGETRLSWVIGAAESFINSFKFVEGAKIALIVFNDSAEVLSDFSDNKNHLLEQLKKIGYDGGGTNYTPAFLDTENGCLSLLAKQPSDIRRIAVFLTDGKPNVSPETDEISDKALKTNVQIFSLTLLFQMNPELRRIARETGGKAYDIWDKHALKNIYKLIAFYSQITQLCEISWTAPLSCNPALRERYAQISFLRQSQTRENYYEAPEESVPRIVFSEKSYGFKRNGTAKATVDIKFSAKYSDFHIDSVYLKNGDYFKITDWKGVPPPFSMKKGEERKITAEFAPDNLKRFRSDLLSFEAHPCPAAVYLYGGKPEIELIKPNGGEIFSKCGNINIKWEGTNEEDKTDVYYLDGEQGVKQTIDSGIRTESYFWRPFESFKNKDKTNLKIIVESKPELEVQWLRKIGGIKNENSVQMKFNGDSSSFYAYGNFVNSLSANNQNQKVAGGRDVFLLKFDSEGNILKTSPFGGDENDSAASFEIDESGNVYCAGTFKNNFAFKSNSFDDFIRGKNYAYIMKLNSAGEFKTIDFFGASSRYQNLDVKALKVKTNAREVVLFGKYKGRFVYDDKLYISDSSYSLFKISYGKYLTRKSFSEVERTPSNLNNLKSLNIKLNDGVRISYKTHYFGDALSFGSQTFTGGETGNFAIYKTVEFEQTEDDSDSLFAIDSPSLRKEIDSVIIQNAQIGKKKTISVERAAFNDSDNLNTFVEEIKLIGESPASFQILALEDSLIQPGEYLNLKARFFAEEAIDKRAKAVIIPSCADSIIIPLIGEGVCDLQVKDTIRTGQMNVGFGKNIVVEKAVYNPLSFPISVNPKIAGKDVKDFIIVTESPISIDSRSYAKLFILFIPSDSGRREAKIEYDFDACRDKSAILLGQGLKNDISASAIDWGVRRIKTINDSTALIENDNALDIIIESIELIKDNDNCFEFLSDIKTPIQLKRGDSLIIPVNFKPKDEKSYFNAISIGTNLFDSALTVPLFGIGALPKLKTQWNCGGTPAAGDSSLGNFILINESSSAPLQIFDCRIIYNQNEFAFLENFTETTIPPNKSIELKTLFAPQKPGTRAGFVKIKSDAFPGPEINPINTSITSIECEAAGAIHDSTIKYGGVLKCSEDIINIEIINYSDDEKIIIEGYEIENLNDNSTFEPPPFIINLDSTLTIPPKDTARIRTAFAPMENIEYKAVLRFYVKNKKNIELELTGIGETINLFADKTSLKMKPGESKNFSIACSAPAINRNVVSEITLRIDYNPKALRFTINETPRDLPLWNWNVKSIDPSGVMLLKGEGVLPTPYDGEILSGVYRAFLSDTSGSENTFRLTNKDCQSSNDLNVNVKIQSVCFGEGRLVEVFDGDYFLATPYPNPCEDYVNVEFGVATETLTTIEIRDRLGNLKTTYKTKSAASGRYKVKFNLDKFPSGAYFVIMKSGCFRDLKKITLTK